MLLHTEAHPAELHLDAPYIKSTNQTMNSTRHEEHSYF